jgi:hypothetical protein
MSKRKPISWIILLAATVAVGCGKPEKGPRQAADRTNPPVADHAFLLDAEPPGAIGVAETRRTATDEAEVVVVGRVGGSKQPFVDGLAAFQIVDPALPPCRPDCGCPTPWDFCCDLNILPENKATIKVVDKTSNPLDVDARQLLGIKELTTVVVRGKARRDEAGNLSVLADGIYVRPEDDTESGTRR